MAGKKTKYSKEALEWAAAQIARTRLVFKSPAPDSYDGPRLDKYVKDEFGQMPDLMKMSPSDKEVMNRVIDDLILYGASGYRESSDGTITHLSQEELGDINDLATEIPQDEPEDPNLTPFQKLLLRAKNKK